VGGPWASLVRVPEIDTAGRITLSPVVEVSSGWVLSYACDLEVFVVKFVSPLTSRRPFEDLFAIGLECVLTESKRMRLALDDILIAHTISSRRS